MAEGWRGLAGAGGLLGGLQHGRAVERAAMVLSDLLARADERVGELAKALDRAQIAGRQCEREYDALTHDFQMSAKPL